MTKRSTIHFVHGDSRVRAQAARVCYEMERHAEVYCDLDELIGACPRSGMIFAQDRPDGDHTMPAPARMLDLLGRAGIWLPVIMMAENPDRARVIAAIKAGVLDYLPLPLAAASLHNVWSRLESEAAAFAEGRRRMIEARQRINHLSQREREVLEKLAAGNSNKAIARALAISPRTVEIHRANMMGKLGAHHAAEAVRIRIEARLDELEDAPVNGRG